MPNNHDSGELSIIIPSFNEEVRIPSTLDDILNFCSTQQWKYEILVVDDGSTDRTAAVVKDFSSRHPEISLVQLAQNEGKGWAVRTGMLTARYNMRIFVDADGATPFSEVLKLIQEIARGADIAIASRALPSSDTRVNTLWYRKFLGRTFNWCINFLILPGIADTQCGFKIFTGRAAEFLFSRQTARRFSFDVELLYLARKVGMQIHEVPVNWTNVPGSKVNLLVDAMKMFWDVFGFRVKHRGVTAEEWLHKDSARGVTK